MIGSIAITWMITSMKQVTNLSIIIQTSIPFIGDMMIQILNPTTYSRPHKKVAHSSFPCLFAHDIQNPALFQTWLTSLHRFCPSVENSPDFLPRLPESVWGRHSIDLGLEVLCDRITLLPQEPCKLQNSESSVTSEVCMHSVNMRLPRDHECNDP